MQPGTRRAKCKSQPKPEFESGGMEQLHQQLKEYELPLFQNGWSIYLQLLLLDGMELFGCQNWEMIAQYLNCTFNSEEIRDHYYRVYGDNAECQYNFPAHKMLINNDDDDIYIAALNKEKNRIRKEERTKKEKNVNEDESQFDADNYQKMHKPQKTNSKKIPTQFGYEQAKNIFAQPFNEEAQIMIVGLTISKNDSAETKESKLLLLRQYNRLILERRIVQKQIMDNQLMQCKYSLSSSNMIIRIPQPSSNGAKPVGRSRIKNESGSKAEEKKKENLFFRIKRRINNQLCEPFHVGYMKIIKFDQNETLKNILKKYQEKCCQMKYFSQMVNNRI